MNLKEQRLRERDRERYQTRYTGCGFASGIAALITGLFIGYHFLGLNTTPAKLVFAGRIVNSETGEWPNDRLVLAFLKSQELGRTVTKTGEFKDRGLGVHDGLYEIVAENTYKVTIGQLNAGLSAAGTNTFDRVGDTALLWLSDFPESSSLEIPIPEKNITYTLKSFAGNVVTLPAEMLQPGSTRLKPDGAVVVAINAGELANAGVASDGAGGAAFVESVDYNTGTDNVIVNKLTVPINNCGGSGRVTQRYVQSQTFIHQYTAEMGGGVGVQFGLPWMQLLVELQGKYGFENGQIDSRTADTTLEVEPGTNQVFLIEWSEVWDTGVATMLISSDRVESPFRVKKDVIYRIDSQRLECP